MNLKCRLNLILSELARIRLQKNDHHTDKPPHSPDIKSGRGISETGKSSFAKPIGRAPKDSSIAIHPRCKHRGILAKANKYATHFILLILFTQNPDHFQ